MGLSILALLAALASSFAFRGRTGSDPAQAKRGGEQHRYAQVSSTAAAKLQLDRLYALGIESLRADLFDQAAKILAIAAERGHARAQLHLGVLCEHGIGVPLDLERAMHWYRCAMDQGDADAEFRLQVAHAQQAKAA